MSNLRRNWNRFLFRNRNKGIPNLMLWIVIGNVIVYLFSMFNTSFSLYEILCFDSALIMRGQVWRLFSYVFTFSLSYGSRSIIFLALGLYCCYWPAKYLENGWGTLKFNLYYLCGVVLMDLAGLLMYLCFRVSVPVTVFYLNLTLFLGVATMMPENRVLFMFFIPLKMKWLALVYLGLNLVEIIPNVITVINALSAGVGWGVALPALIYAFFPLIALLNYFIFFGRGVKVLLPLRMQNRGSFAERRQRAEYRRKTAEPDFRQGQPGTPPPSSGERPYRHKCTVCGRTDVSCPGLEFRYCSKCRGYFCYCIDHINNHTHVQ